MPSDADIWRGMHARPPHGRKQRQSGLAASQIGRLAIGRSMIAVVACLCDGCPSASAEGSIEWPIADLTNHSGRGNYEWRFFLPGGVQIMVLGLQRRVRSRQACPVHMACWHPQSRIMFEHAAVSDLQTARLTPTGARCEVAFFSSMWGCHMIRHRSHFKH